MRRGPQPGTVSIDIAPSTSIVMNDDATAIRHGLPPGDVADSLRALEDSLAFIGATLGMAATDTTVQQALSMIRWHPTFARFVNGGG